MSTFCKSAHIQVQQMHYPLTDFLVLVLLMPSLWWLSYDDDDRTQHVKVKENLEKRPSQHTSSIKVKVWGVLKGSKSEHGCWWYLLVMWCWWGRYWKNRCGGKTRLSGGKKASESLASHTWAFNLGSAFHWHSWLQRPRHRSWLWLIFAR